MPCLVEAQSRTIGESQFLMVLRYIFFAHVSPLFLYNVFLHLFNTFFFLFCVWTGRWMRKVVPIRSSHSVDCSIAYIYSLLSEGTPFGHLNEQLWFLSFCCYEVCIAMHPWNFTRLSDWNFPYIQELFPTHVLDLSSAKDCRYHESDIWQHKQTLYL